MKKIPLTNPAFEPLSILATEEENLIKLTSQALDRYIRQGNIKQDNVDDLNKIIRSHRSTLEEIIKTVGGMVFDEKVMQCNVEYLDRAKSVRYLYNDNAILLDIDE